MDGPIEIAATRHSRWRVPCCTSCGVAVGVAASLALFHSCALAAALVLVGAGLAGLAVGLRS